MLHLRAKKQKKAHFMFQIPKISVIAAIMLATSQTLVCGQCISYHELPNQQLLPTPNIDIVMQDRDGYMWYGTAGGGVCRDDGYRMTTFNSETEGCGVMKSDVVTCLAQDSCGQIWVGTRAGLYLIDKDCKSIQKIECKHIGDRKINCIAVSADGAIWVGLKQSIIKFAADGTYSTRLSIGDNKREEPREMMLDSHGTIWVTILRGGICTIDPKNDSLTHRPWNYPSAASYIAEDTLRHCYWVGTWGGGIVRYPEMTVEPATTQQTGIHKFSSEIYNLWIDRKTQLMWVTTMDDIYAYRMNATAESAAPCLSPFPLDGIVPSGKKMIGKLTADRHGNVWIPGHSPHTFILSSCYASGHIRRDAVNAMSQQTDYKIMVSKIACEGDFYWIYQNRTRLSLYNSNNGQLAFMANDASPEPLSTQRPLSRCRTDKGVWTCNGRRLVHAWHDGMKIYWREVPEATMPHYISALNDVGDGRLLVGTEREVMLYDYVKKTLQKLADSDGVVQQVSFSADGKLLFTTDEQAAQTITDTNGHIWTRSEMSLTEFSPKTGATRTFKPTDRNIGMDSFTDITIVGDSICLGGIGAFCIIGSCRELDEPHASDKIVTTRIDTLQAIHLSTMNQLHAANVRFAYRFNPSDEWTELPAGQNVIDLNDIGHGNKTLWVRATDEYGLWHDEQAVCTISNPWPWHLWATLAAIGIALAIIVIRHRKKVAARRRKALSETRIDPFMTQVEAVVRSNMGNVDFGVEALCRELSMSRMNMYRKFQSSADVTPSEYIRLYRLRRASELLRTTSKTVAEIAYEVGFTSPQYLAKCFKEEYGITPKEARQG